MVFISDELVTSNHTIRTIEATVTQGLHEWFDVPTAPTACLRLCS